MRYHNTFQLKAVGVLISQAHLKPRARVEFHRCCVEAHNHLQVGSKNQDLRDVMIFYSHPSPGFGEHFYFQGPDLSTGFRHVFLQSCISGHLAYSYLFRAFLQSCKTLRLKPVRKTQAEGDRSQSLFLNGHLSSQGKHSQIY